MSNHIQTIREALKLLPAEQGQGALSALEKHEKLYLEAAQDSLFLDALRAAGVDNWEGYGAACEAFNED